MPREQITYPKVGQAIGADGQPAGLIESDSPLLHVSWLPSRGDGAGYVQVALEARKAWLAQLLTDNAKVQATDGVSLFTDTLDRQAINRAIRVLRRARDAAYGRDE